MSKIIVCRNGLYLGMNDDWYWGMNACIFPDMFAALEALEYAKNRCKGPTPPWLPNLEADNIEFFVLENSMFPGVIGGVSCTSDVTGIQYPHW